MKRLVSALFLLLIFLNAIGYYGLLIVARERLTQEVLQKIDDNAGIISGNMILKIPFSLPYTGDSQEYERANGEITYGGEVYRIVKQRVHGDTLYIVCMRDTQTTEVNQVISEYSKNLTDQDQKSTSHLKLISPLAKEYLATFLYSKSSAIGWSLPISKESVESRYHYTPRTIIFHPPQVTLLAA